MGTHMDSHGKGCEQHSAMKHVLHELCTESQAWRTSVSFDRSHPSLSDLSAVYGYAGTSLEDMFLGSAWENWKNLEALYGTFQLS